MLLYEVLDYRLEDSEERELSADIANLIEVMLDAGSEVHLVGELSNKLYFLLKLHLTQYPHISTTHVVLATACVSILIKMAYEFTEINYFLCYIEIITPGDIRANIS